jgi:hypothetical protein
LPLPDRIASHPLSFFSALFFGSVGGFEVARVRQTQPKTTDGQLRTGN